jgi:hypothetical protein
MRSRPVTAFLFYFLLTLLFLYPIPFELKKLVSIAPDMFQNLWNFWWVRESLLELRTSPYFTEYIFHPTGTSLAFQTFSPYNSLLAIPLQGIFGRIVTYNLLYFSSFLLAALGGYLLAFHFLRDRYAAFLAGFIFAFSPFHFSRVMQINILSIQWIPFYCLFLIKLRERACWTNALGVALFLILTAMCSWYYMIYLVLFSLIYLVYYTVTESHTTLRPRFYLLLLFSLSIFLLVISPFVIPLLREMSTNESYLYDPVHSGSDIFGFSLFKGYFYFWPVFLGYTTLFLSFYAAMVLRDREVRFWWIMAIFAFVMTLGTHLKVLGRDYPEIPLPYALMQEIPIFGAARIPYRFLVLVMLSLSILSGYTIRSLRASLLKPGYLPAYLRRMLLFLLFFLVTIEFLVIPRPNYSPDIPPLYKSLSTEKGDFAIASLPFKDRGWDLFFQTFYEKRIVWGYVSRRDPKAMEYLSTTPPFNLFLDPDLIDTEKISSDEALAWVETLKKLEFRYILIIKPKRYSNLGRLGRPSSTLNFLRVGCTPYFLNRELHKSLIEIEQVRGDIKTTDEEITRFKGLLGTLLGDQFYEDDAVIAYRVPQI